MRRFRNEGDRELMRVQNVDEHVLQRDGCSHALEKLMNMDRPQLAKKPSGSPFAAGNAQ